MSKPNDRGGLMNLRMNLPQIAPVQRNPELEDRLLGADGRKDVSTATTVDPTAGAHPPKEGTILLNAKIPVSLHTRLKRTAQYNEVSMTDILMRGLEKELSSGGYAPPPSEWGRK